MELAIALLLASSLLAASFSFILTKLPQLPQKVFVYFGLVIDSSLMLFLIILISRLFFLANELIRLNSLFNWLIQLLGFLLALLTALQVFFALVQQGFLFSKQQSSQMIATSLNEYKKIFLPQAGFCLLYAFWLFISLVLQN